MKKIKKFLPFVLPVMCLSAVGCSKRTIQEDVITVKLLLGGYGTEWLYKAQEKFEQIYANEGYKIDIITPNRTVTGSNVKNELISGYQSSKVDLYFTGSLKPSNCVDDDGSILVEDITDTVYNQKAIRFDGSLEDKTVQEKLDSSFGPEWYQLNGKAYGFFYMKSIGALVVNRKKLYSFGFDNLPITTNQFLNQIRTIHKEYVENGNEGIQPLDMVAGTGYATVMMNSWFTQYSGINAWDTFWSMNNADGTYNTETGYEVYQDKGIDEAAKLVYATFDRGNFATGAFDHDISAAHVSIMSKDEGAVFLFDGDWALNETSVNVKNKEDLKDLSFINVPVISALGTKLWGDMITDPEVCDNVLSKVASMADAGREVSQIKDSVLADYGYELSDESILEVCKARGVYNNRGVETGNAYLAKGIGDHHKDIASKFLRMLASDDFSKMYFDTSKCVSPYSTEINEGTELIPFSQGHAQIATHKYAGVIWPITTGLRNKIGGELEKMFPTVQYFHNYALNNEDSAYNPNTGEIVPNLVTEIYDKYSAAAVKENYDLVKAQWAEWVEPYK